MCHLVDESLKLSLLFNQLQLRSIVCFVSDRGFSLTNLLGLTLNEVIHVLDLDYILYIYCMIKTRCLFMT